MNDTTTKDHLVTASSKKNALQRIFQSFFVLLLGMLLSISSTWGEGGTAPTSPVISISSTSVTEGDVAKVTIRIDKCPSTAPITLTYQTNDGTATAGADYTNKSASITFATGAGCTKIVKVSIPTNDDTEVEGNENFTLSFTASSNQNFSPVSSSADVTINDNDRAPKLSVDIRKQAKNSEGEWKDWDAKGLSINDPIEYKVTATNTGDMSTLKIKDSLPSGLEILHVAIAGSAPSNFSCLNDNRKFNCKGTHIFNRGEKITILLTARATKKGRLWNEATVTPGNGQISALDGVGVYIDTQDIISSYDKSVSSSPDGHYWLDDNVTFTLTATNGGTSPKRLYIEDQLAYTSVDTFEFLGYSSSTMTCSLANYEKLKCDSNAPIAPGETVTISIKARLNKTGIEICNKAYFFGYENRDRIYVGSKKVCLNVKEKNILQTNDDVYTIKRGGTLSENILDNDRGDGREITSLVYENSSTLPDNVLTWQADGSISYTAPDSNGTLVYTYQAKDEYGTTATATVTINVITPEIIAKDDSFNVTKNIPYTGNVFSDNGNGIDSGENISITSHTEPTQGRLTIQNNGQFTYIPAADYTGNDTFTYTIRDTYGQEGTATVSINVGTLFSESFADFYLINPVETRNIIGNYVATGNTVTCLTNQDGTMTGSADYNTACSNNTDINNNNKLVRYIDIDSNPNTWNSSSAQITLPDIYDQNNGGVLWAGLFWQGAVNHHSNYGANKYVQRRAKTSGAGYTYDDIDGTNAVINLNNTDVSKVKLKIGTTGYSDIVADTFYYNMIENNMVATYAAFSNVTTLFQNAQLEKGDHTITLANLTANEGREPAIGNYGGWSLVVIYKEDDAADSAKARNISIYNGFVAIGPDGQDTEKKVHISGFKLPKEGDVNANITTFVGEGEAKYGGHTEAYDTMHIVHHDHEYTMPSNHPNNIFDAQADGITRNANPSKNNLTNTNGIDIDNYDVSNTLKEIRNFEQNASALDIQIISKDENPNDTLYTDYITPSMVAFSAELFVPNLCYNYTLDIGGFVIDSTHNQIVTPALFLTEKPLTTHLSILSKEGDFVLKDTNITYKIANSAQLHYKTDSVGIAKNEISTYLNAGTSGLNQAYAQNNAGFGLYIGDNVGQSPNSGLGGGAIDSHQMRYIRFDDEIISSEVNTSFSVKLKYLIDYGSGPLELTKIFNQKALCPLPAGYRTIRGRFNVTSDHADDTTGKPFNLYTQVANRPFNIKVFSHDDNLTGLVNRNLAVEVEPFNANYYSHDAEISCQDIDTKVTDSTFVYFNNTDHVEIHDLNYNFAMRNIGFRVWNLVDDENLLVTHHCTSANDNSCFKTLYSNKYISTDTKCQTECTNSGAGCYICLRKYYGKASCSQDNFSIRPNAFTSLIKDSNESNSLSNTQTNNISHSHIPSSLGLSPNASIVAGYKYRFDINATNFQDDKATPRYVGLFDGSYNNERYVQFKWDSTFSANDCANTDDVNMTLPLMDGRSVIPSLDYTYTQSINNLGEYKLLIFDQNWTAVDWAETSHHLQNPEWDTAIVDCVKNDTKTLDISVNDTSERNGCAISNIHADSVNTYIAPKLHTYPYSFDLSQLKIGAGPQNDKDYVFMDTLLSTKTDYDMSYNIQGMLQAKAYPDGSLENFTKTCYAADINMSLGTSYLSSLPDITENKNFRYNLIDFKKDSSPMIQRKDEIFTEVYSGHQERALIVKQYKSVFTKEMNGSIDMDLGYNFDRAMNAPINPRAIHFSDFNVMYTTPPAKLYFRYRNDYKVEAQRVIDQNVTFVYGRVKPTQNFYDSVTETSVVTPLSITAYCDDVTNVCLNDYRIGVIADNNISTRSNEAFWWFVQSHNQANGEGSILLSTPSNFGISDTSPEFNKGIANALTITYTGASRPFITNITLDPLTSRWIIYNPNNDAIPNPFYRVRFIGNAGWTGEGKTGHVVGDNINKKTNRKMEW